MEASHAEAPSASKASAPGAPASSMPTAKAVCAKFLNSTETEAEVSCDANKFPRSRPKRPDELLLISI